MNDRLIEFLKTQIDNKNDEDKIEITVDTVKEIVEKIEKQENVIKKANKVFNSIGRIAYCSYWNYENKTCTHTCRDCIGLSEESPKSFTGYLINGNRYCRLYEDNDFYEADTKFVENLDELLDILEKKASEEDERD